MRLLEEFQVPGGTQGRVELLQGDLTDPDWRDAADILEFAARHEFAAQVTMSEDGGQFAYNPAGPRAVRFRVLEEIVARLATEGSPRGEQLARLMEALETGQKATLSGVMCTPRAGSWHFTAAPPRSEG